MTSESETIVQIISDTPAWLTPAVAAGAAILSGFLTWLGSRLNDGRKAKRESKERWDRFILEEAVALGRTCEETHRRMRDGVTIGDLETLSADASVHYEQLSVVAPKEVIQAATRLYGYLLTNIHNRYDYAKIMKLHRAAQGQVTESIRKHVGLPKLEWEPPNPEDVKVGD